MTGAPVPTLLGPLDADTVHTVATYSGWLAFLCVFPLLVQTVRGKAHPPVLTWAIWAPIGLVATVALALDGQPFGTWFEKGMLSAGPLLVAVVAARWGGSWRTDRFDHAAIVIGVIGTAAYVALYVADDWWAPYVAVIMVMLVDGVGVWPTWRRAWRDPRDGFVVQLLTFGLAAVSVIGVLVTLPLPWTFLSAGLLLFLLAQMFSVIGVLIVARALHARRSDQQPAVAPA